MREAHKLVFFRLEGSFELCLGNRLAEVGAQFIYFRAVGAETVRESGKTWSDARN